MQLVESAGGDGFVRRETEDGLGGFVVASDGDAIARSETVEERVNSLKMSALKKIDSRAGFDQEKNLGGFVNAEKIGDGLLDAVVENVEIFAAKASDELPLRIGDEDADVDAVNADADVGSGLSRLLRKSVRSQDGGADANNSGAVFEGARHEGNLNGSPAAKNTEAPSRARFPERGTGLAKF